jgi:hypothetical protein
MDTYRSCKVCDTIGVSGKHVDGSEDASQMCGPCKDTNWV